MDSDKRRFLSPDVPFVDATTLGRNSENVRKETMGDRVVVTYQEGMI